MNNDIWKMISASQLLESYNRQDNSSAHGLKEITKNDYKIKTIHESVDEIVGKVVFPRIFNSKILRLMKKQSLNTMVEQIMKIVMENWELENRNLSKLLAQIGLLHYPDSNAKIKILQFSSDYPYSITDVLSEALTEEFKIIEVPENEFRNLDVNIGKTFGICDRSRIGNKQKTDAI